MNNNSLRTSRFTREWVIFFFCFAVMGSWLGYVSYDEYLRVDTLERERLTDNAAVIHDHISHQLISIGTTLSSVRRNLGVWSRQQDGMSVAHEHLKSLADAMPNVHSIGILDADGNVLTSTRKAVIGKNFAYREYFRAPQKNPDPDTLYISSPFQSVLGLWTLTLSRAVIGPDGKFAGVVTASLAAQEFNVLMQAIRYSPDLWSAVIHGDGTLFLSSPDHKEPIGMNMATPGSFFSRHIKSNREVSIFTGYAAGEEQMVVLRTIQPAKFHMDKPIIFKVAREIDAIYAEWEKNTLRHSSLYILLVLVGAGGLFFSQKKRRFVERETSKAEALVRAARRELETFFDVSPDLLCMVDLDGHFRKISPSWTKLLGYSLKELEGSAFMDYVHPTDVAATKAIWLKQLNGEAVAGFTNRYRRQDGAYCFIEWCSVCRENTIYAVARDVGERKEAELKLRFMAYHDGLTGLPNRQLFFDRLARSISNAKRNKKQFGLLFIDLDGFKQVNDRYGHEAGDITLQTVADRFVSSLRENDTVARMAGDEFVVILNDLGNAHEAGYVARKLLDAIAPAIVIADGMECHVGASIGIGIFPDNGTEMDTLLVAADAAMYQCKKNGKNNYMFSGDISSAETNEADLIFSDELHKVGVREIDEQHQVIVNALSNLSAAIKNNIDEKEITLLFDELGRLISSHFLSEENLMKRYAYPGLESHKAEHEYFLAEIPNVKMKVSKGFGELFMVRLIRHYLMHHILKEDKQLGEFIRQNDIKG